MKATIYHNPNCSSSCLALEYLERYEIDTTVKLYMDKGIVSWELYEILELTNCHITDLIRKKEQVFIDKYCVEGVLSSKESFFNAIVEDPILLQRPIILFREKGIGAIVKSEDAIIKLFKLAEVDLSLDDFLRPVDQVGRN